MENISSTNSRKRHSTVHVVIIKIIKYIILSSLLEMYSRLIHSPVIFNFLRQITAGFR